MGQWKVTTLMARDSKSGEWEVLDGPGVDRRNQQRKLLHELTNAKGEYKGKQYGLAGITSGFMKRRKFTPAMPKMPVTILDDLSPMAEPELKEVIKAEKLAIKMDKDHEKVRSAIRKAREPKASPKAAQSGGQAEKAKAEKGKGKK